MGIGQKQLPVLSKRFPITRRRWFWMPEHHKAANRVGQSHFTTLSPHRFLGARWHISNRRQSPGKYNAYFLKPAVWKGDTRGPSHCTHRKLFPLMRQYGRITRALTRASPCWTPPGVERAFNSHSEFVWSLFIILRWFIRVQGTILWINGFFSSEIFCTWEGFFRGQIESLAIFFIHLFNF